MPWSLWAVLVLGILVQFNDQRRVISLERERFRGTHDLGSHDNDDRSLPCAAGRVLHVRKPAQSQCEAMARREKRVPLCDDVVQNRELRSALGWVLNSDHRALATFLPINAKLIIARLFFVRSFRGREL